MTCTHGLNREIVDCLQCEDEENTTPTNRAIPDRWLIWSNEHRAWWGPGCCGYLDNIAAAGRYTLEQAVNICTQRSWMRGQVPPETMIHESSLPRVIAKAAA